MVTLEQLWIPIVLSAVLVFVASSLIHMVFKWHNSDYRKLPNEDDVRAAMRAGSPAPGQYVIPYCADMKDMQSPEMQKKFTDGPLAAMFVRANGAPRMGPMLGQWFALSLVIAIVVGYLAAHTVPRTASFLGVARVVSLITFLAYGAGGVIGAIWWGKPWRSAMKELLDAFIYGLVTAVAFGWLWPR